MSTLCATPVSILCATHYDQLTSSLEDGSCRPQTHTHKLAPFVSSEPLCWPSSCTTSSFLQEGFSETPFPCFEGEISMQPLLQQGCFSHHGSVAMGTVGEHLWVGIGFYDSLRQWSLPSLYKDPTSLLQALLESGPLGKVSVLSLPALWSSIRKRFCDFFLGASPVSSHGTREVKQSLCLEMQPLTPGVSRLHSPQDQGFLSSSFYLASTCSCPCLAGSSLLTLPRPLHRHSCLGAVRLPGAAFREEQRVIGRWTADKGDWGSGGACWRCLFVTPISPPSSRDYCLYLA